MTHLWSLSGLIDQFSVRIQRGWSVSQSAMTPQAILCGLTMAFLVLSIALGSFLLFLLVVVQGVVIFQLQGGTVREASAPVTAEFARLRQHLPTAGAVLRTGWQIGMMIYHLFYRLTMCILIALSAGLAALSAFVLNQAELWQWTTLQTAGPPLGPVLVTGLVIVSTLLMSGWVASRWPLLPR